MHKHIVVKLPCKNLPASKAFFEALGYRCNPQFTKEAGAGVVLHGRVCAWVPTRSTPLQT